MNSRTLANPSLPPTSDNISFLLYDHTTPLPLKVYVRTLRTYFLYIHTPLLINFYSDSSFRHSQFLGYFHIYLALRFNQFKKIFMVFIYSLRTVYTFLYTIINGNVIASFVQKNKSFEILWSKKIFFAYQCNLEAPLTPRAQ